MATRELIGGVEKWHLRPEKCWVSETFDLNKNKFWNPLNMISPEVLGWVAISIPESQMCFFDILNYWYLTIKENTLQKVWKITENRKSRQKPND